MRRVLVTGGAGTIGTAVVRRLLRDQDWEVRVCDHRQAPEWMRQSCELQTGDLRDLEVAREALDGCSDVIHLAAIVGGIANFHKLPFTLTEVNNALTGAIVHASVERDVRRFVYVSSSMVFERATEFPTTEGHVDSARRPARHTGSRSSPARCTRARRMTSMDCATRSAALSTPTGLVSCRIPTSRGSRTRSRT